jgi:ectoine hydroxylase-related dioxygenase (phytanoyl-CoA dioxygenase family)
MITTGSEPDSRPVYRVTPSPGTLLIWPSPLQHAVYPNLSGDLRISISFNVIVDKK